MIRRASPYLVAMAALCATAPADAQEFTPEQLRAIMERHAEAAQPGPEHDLLASLAGTWRSKIRIWPAPGEEPVGADATVEASLILGGRFLLQHALIEGGPFEGESYNVLGFDRRSGEFTWLALDTTGTYWVSARGIPDETGRRVVMSGTDHDAIAGADQIYDVVVDWTDASIQRLEIIFKDRMHTRGGDPHRMVEIVSQRTDVAGGAR